MTTEFELGSEKLLSKGEKERLDYLLVVVDENIKGFLKVGAALMEIREGRLYRETHLKFETFCSDIWDMSRRNADRLISAKEVTDNLRPMGLVLGNERQARPLTSLETEDQITVAERILTIKEKYETKITASLISLEVRKFLGQKIIEKEREIKKRVARDSVVSTDFKKGFNVFLEHIQFAKEDGWNETSKQATLKYLDEARELIINS